MNPDLAPPWWVATHQNGLIKVENKHRVIFDGFSGEEGIARLVAAAPELLAALQNMLACADAGDMDSLVNASEDARAALAKASGDSD